MQIFSYLSKIASSGSILSWDGTKIAASRAILHNPSEDKTTIGSSLTVEKPITASGGILSADGKSYIYDIIAGDNVEINSQAGAVEISVKTQEQYSPVLWRWNEKDTSQFTVSCDTIGTGSLSVINTSWGKALRVDFKQNSSDGVFAFNINDLNIPADENNRYRYLIKFRVCNFSGIPKEWTGMGVTFFSNSETGENYYGLGNVCFFNSPNNKAIKFDGGKIQLGKNSPPGPKISLQNQFGRPITKFEHEVIGITTRRSIGFQNSWTVINSSSERAGGSGLDDAYYSSEFGSFKSDWGKQDLDTCGFVFLAGQGNTPAHFDIDCIEVLKHPMDW